MKKIFILLLVSIPHFILGQNSNPDRGNINFHFGSIIAYKTYSIGYESFDLLKNTNHHQLRAIIRFGGWKSTFMNTNTGSQQSIGLSYLYGKTNHFLEFSSELVNHFDRGLKGQSIVYIGSMYRPFLGYRYQPVDKKIVARLGVGWKEVFQIGLGYRF
jgi:hypothetical protein